MIKTLCLFALIPLFLFSANANAQVDTTKLDLGRLVLDKNFTQTVTVKGSDLEKMPVHNLSEAINVWFYGTYTNSAGCVYVIDGNLVSDVNQYSVFDIDEVTLVQNALTRIAGAVQQQQLILVKTKRHKEKGYGITANVQDYISQQLTNNIPVAYGSNTYETGIKSTDKLFQEYYLSAYKNTNSVQFGLSAGLTHDDVPALSGENIQYLSPASFYRYRLNGYFTAKMGSSVLDISAGYVPEGEQVDFTTTASSVSYINQNTNQHDHMVNANIRLTTTMLPNFTNVLHAGYNLHKGGAQIDENDGPTSATLADNDVQHSFALAAYDNLNYNAKFGDWGLEPAVNLMFRTFKDSLSNVYRTLNSSGTIVGANYEAFNEHMFLLTPSVNLYYKKYFNLQVGTLDNLASIGSFNVGGEKKVFPFASASVDVVQLLKSGSSLSVKLYGAYSQSYFWLDEYNALDDFSASNINIGSLMENGTMQEVAYGTSGNIDYKNYVTGENTGSKSFKTFSAGLTITPLKSGFSFNYFFQQGSYLSPLYIEVPAYVNFVGTISIYNNTSAYLHRLGINYALNNSSAFHWRTGLNTTLLEQEYPVSSTVKDPNIGKGQWTGGWINRLSYRSFFAGMDGLYQFNEKAYVSSPTNTGVLNTISYNSFVLQNVYAGYRFKVRGLNDLEAFINARNLFQNKQADITDDRQYFGLGLKASL